MNVGIGPGFLWAVSKGVCIDFSTGYKAQVVETLSNTGEFVKEFKNSVGFKVGISATIN